MTKEELKLEAESKLDDWSDPDMGYEEGYCYSEVADFMFRFAEPREKRIEELEQQIEKMKRCSNCRHPKNPMDNICTACNNYSKWELKK